MKERKRSTEEDRTTAVSYDELQIATQGSGEERGSKMMR
jgi:hypothetical protein